MPAPFVKTVEFIKEDIQENGVFTGYGSTFGGKPDSYGDIIAEGAFSKSLSKNGRGGLGIAMLWQHKADKIPGVWKKFWEDKKGLGNEGMLALKTQLGSDAYELMQIGGIKAQSIGFDLPRDKTGKVKPSAYELDKTKNTRLLKEINLWEVSLVTFPANTNARITGVKNLKEARTVRELEHYLRDLGLSKNEACHLASMCKSGLRDSGADNEVEEILDTINKTVEDMKTNPVIDILNTLNSVNEAII